MTTIEAPPAHDDPPCEHNWQWVDWRNAFICTICYLTDDAA